MAFKERFKDKTTLVGKDGDGAMLVNVAPSASPATATGVPKPAHGRRSASPTAPPKGPSGGAPTSSPSPPPPPSQMQQPAQIGSPAGGIAPLQQPLGRPLMPMPTAAAKMPAPMMMPMPMAPLGGGGGGAQPAPMAPGFGGGVPPAKLPMGGWGMPMPMGGAMSQPGAPAAAAPVSLPPPVATSPTKAAVAKGKKSVAMPAPTQVGAAAPAAVPSFLPPIVQPLQAGGVKSMPMGAPMMMGGIPGPAAAPSVLAPSAAAAPPVQAGAKAGRRARVAGETPSPAPAMGAAPPQQQQQQQPMMMFNPAMGGMGMGMQPPFFQQAPQFQQQQQQQPSPTKSGGKSVAGGSKNVTSAHQQQQQPPMMMMMGMPSGGGAGALGRSDVPMLPPAEDPLLRGGMLPGKYDYAAAMGGGAASPSESGGGRHNGSKSAKKSEPLNHPPMKVGANTAAPAAPRSEKRPASMPAERPPANYTPYSLADYKKLADAPIRRGGLGPSDTDEQRFYREMRKRAQEYADHSNRINLVLMAGDGEAKEPKPIGPQYTERTVELQQRRQKALEFAKHVPKPKVRTSDDDEDEATPSAARNRRTDKGGSTAKHRKEAFVGGDDAEASEILAENERTEKEKQLMDLEARHKRDQEMIENIKRQLKMK